MYYKPCCLRKFMPMAITIMLVRNAAFASVLNNSKLKFSRSQIVRDYNIQTIRVTYAPLDLKLSLLACLRVSFNCLPDVLMDFYLLYPRV